VSSLRVANARIAYSAKGVLADANQAGWLTRFFTGPLMPF
jgi:flagellar L-ring protein precursor FlgH